VRGISVEHILRLPVRLRGIHLGRPVDLVLDKERRRALGFEVQCGDEEHRFLPFAVVSIRDDEIELPSPLVLLEAAELAFYTKRGSTFRAIVGSDVVRGREFLGELEDLRVEPDGGASTVVVATEHGSEALDYGDDVKLLPSGSRVRAAS
jgi:hypothetical protein